MAGQADLLWSAVVAEGWPELLPLRFVMFAEVGLPADSNDRDIWQFCQTHQMIWLTDNRSARGKDSLGQTLREENANSSLPVLTIGNRERLSERAYRVACAERMVEILLDLDNYLGASRLFIP